MSFETDGFKELVSSYKEVKFRGIFKLTEECGELLTDIGKLAVFPDVPHPDGKGLMKPRIQDELADVLAAVQYFIETNDFDKKYINDREQEKLKKFRQWELDGIL
jgi:NTP pyrophosphatase (non-canonical NTP hydrolase)